MLIYKGYTAEVEYDPDAKLLFGEVTNTRDTITFKAYRAEDVETEFHTSVDAHLEACAEFGVEPSKPYPNGVAIRTNSELTARITCSQ